MDCEIHSLQAADQIAGAYLDARFVICITHCPMPAQVLAPHVPVGHCLPGRARPAVARSRCLSCFPGWSPVVPSPVPEPDSPRNHDANLRLSQTFGRCIWRESCMYLAHAHSPQPRTGGPYRSSPWPALSRHAAGLIAGPSRVRPDLVRPCAPSCSAGPSRR